MFEFLGIGSIQVHIEWTKASIGCYIDLRPDLKISKSTLYIRNSKYSCIQLTLTDWLHPAMDHATREIQYVNNINDPRRKQEDDFADIIRIQKLYKTNIGVYTPHGERKVKLFEPVEDIDKDRKDVRILALIDRPNKMKHKF